MKKRPKEKIVRTTVSFSSGTLAAIDEVAEHEGLTRAQAIRWLARRGLKVVNDPGMRFDTRGASGR